MTELESIRQMRQPKRQQSLAAGEVDQTDRFFKALADKTRRKILLLLDSRELSVNEIVAEFDLSQPTISRHLAVLREARLVSDRRQGQRVIYRLNMTTLADSLTRFIGEFRRSHWFL